MKKIRFSKFVIITTSASILIPVGIFFVLRYPISLGTVGPLNNVLTQIDQTIGSPFVSLQDLFQANAANKQLRKELRQMTANEADVTKLEEENQALKESLAIREEFASLTVLTAKVTVRSPVSWLNYLRVNLGKTNQVTKNMMAVSEGGLVGTVSQVGANSSLIKLLSNTRNTEEIPVKIKAEKGDVFGILTAYDADDGTFVISQLNASTSIEKDDAVETSGLDGKSVKGISVGKVVSVKNNSNNLSRQLTVKPTADLSNISYVNLLGE